MEVERLWELFCLRTFAEGNAQTAALTMLLILNKCAPGIFRRWQTSVITPLTAYLKRVLPESVDRDRLIRMYTHAVLIIGAFPVTQMTLEGVNWQTSTNTAQIGDVFDDDTMQKTPIRGKIDFTISKDTAASGKSRTTVVGYLGCGVYERGNWTVKRAVYTADMFDDLKFVEEFGRLEIEPMLAVKPAAAAGYVKTAADPRFQAIRPPTYFDWGKILERISSDSTWMRVDTHKIARYLSINNQCRATNAIGAALKQCVTIATSNTFSVSNSRARVCVFCRRRAFCSVAGGRV